MSADNKDDLGLDGLDDLQRKPAAKKTASARPKAETPETSETSEPRTQIINNSTAPDWSPESLAALREQIKNELLEEFHKQQLKAASDNSTALDRAIEATHKGTKEPGGDTGNPLKLPEVDDPDKLPPLVHFVTDGFTINEKVTYRGQEYVPTKHDTWATMTTQDQIRRYGEIKFRVGPWDGLPFDLTDPNLSEEDRIKLEAVMQDRYAQRVSAPLPPPVE